MKQIYKYGLIGLLFIIAVLPAWADDEVFPDSLLTKDHVYELTFSDQDKAKKIIDLMRKQKKEPVHVLDILEGDLCFNNGKYYLALGFYTRALNNASVRAVPMEYMEQIHRMISCYDCVHDEPKKMQYVNLLLRKAIENNCMEMKSIALFNLGKAIYYQEDKDRGYRYINEAINLMEKGNYKYKYDNLCYDYNTLLMMQQLDKRYKEALQTLEALNKLIGQETNGVPYIEGLNEQEHKTMLANRAIILYRLGRSKEAEQAYKQWKSIGTIHDKDNYLIIPYLFDLKRYDDLIFLNTARENFLRKQNDTINYHMRTIKRSLGKAYCEKGDYKKAADYFWSLTVLTDSLKIREQKSMALEMATLHDVHEKNIQIAEQENELRNRVIIFRATICVLVLSFIVIILILKYLQNTKRKNRAVIGLIREYQQREKQQKIMLPDLEQNVPEQNSDDEGEVTPDNRLRLVFDDFCYQMEIRKMYRDPQLTRDGMVAMLYTNKNLLINAIQEYTGMGYTDYVNSLRMQEALELLSDPTLTVETIATRVGFGSTSTFNRQFKAKYSMNPNDFRKNV